MQSMFGAENTMMQTPADFTDPQRMLGASPALLQGKILRGGMGTGMPMWGPIFTEQQIWDLVSYLYSFPFEYRKLGFLAISATVLMMNALVHQEVTGILLSQRQSSWLGNL